jgi:uncharacterized protein
MADKPLNQDEPAPLQQSGRTAGYHSWKRLTFLHWRVPVMQLQRLLPAELQIECFDGSGWLGVVPFSMERIRPWWFPAVPRISYFLETNLRTYVRHQSGQTGVWFFSLEANSRLAVTVAKSFWRLPYHHAQLSLEPGTGESPPLSYASQRTADSRIGCRITVDWKPTSACHPAEPGTLEYFLLERYVLFAPGRRGCMQVGQVHHAPYQFRSMRVTHCEQTLTSELVPALDATAQPDHAVYCPGVDVVVGALRPACPGKPQPVSAMV